MADELPSYSPSTQVGSPSTSQQIPEFAPQTYSLEDNKGVSWIWLKIKSRAKGAKQLPIFFQGDVIEGEVEVDFSKADGAKAVTIAAHGGVTTVGQDEFQIFDITRELWDAKSSPKPKGKLSWPFSFTLPSEVMASDKIKGKPSPFRLPPSFSERAASAYVDYKFIITVRKGAFKINQAFNTTFVYIPVTQASPPSKLRKMAYQDQTPLVGPEIDFDGWKVFPSFKITGTLFNTLPVDIECSFAIAQPLSFALGSPVPLYLTFRSDDETALDVLAKPSSVNVFLQRERKIGYAALSEGAEGTTNTFREPLGKAYFWPDGASEHGKRTLQGEVLIKKGSKPSFAFPRFSLQYFITLKAFQTSGFTGANADTIHVSEKLAVHTVNEPGIVTRSYAPPGYSDVEEGNYATTAGMLENGNQRFLHHGGFQ